MREVLHGSGFSEIFASNIDLRESKSSLAFRLVSDMLFNPDFALWSYSSINQMCMQINPSSGIANDEHLRYFHFTGRLLGKALFDRQIVAGHLVRPLQLASVLLLLRH